MIVATGTAFLSWFEEPCWSTTKDWRNSVDDSPVVDVGQRMPFFKPIEMTVSVTVRL